MSGATLEDIDPILLVHPQDDACTILQKQLDSLVFNGKLTADDLKPFAEIIERLYEEQARAGRDAKFGLAADHLRARVAAGPARMMAAEAKTFFERYPGASRLLRS